MKSGKVCVTGAAGLLGSALHRELLIRGREVVALDNFSFGINTSGPQIVSADIRRLEDLEPMASCYTVFHLAAIESRQDCQKHFSQAVDVNIKGTANVLSLCSHKRLIFSSSMTVYGEPDKPVDEERPVDPWEPYSVTKAIGEYLCRAYHFLNGVSFSIVRSSNIYGPGQKLDRLVPSMIVQGLTQKRIEVWTPTVVRDFIYVDDCVDAFISVAESDNAVGEVLNLGTGQGTTTLEVAGIISKFLQVDCVILDKPPPISSKLVPDITKVKTVTGWRPRIDLEEGLKRTCEWYQKR